MRICIEFKHRRKKVMGRFKGYPTMHHLGILNYAQSMTAYDSDRVILGIPLQNCVMGMYIVLDVSKPSVMYP